MIDLKLNNFDLLLTSNKKLLLTFNIFNPSCLSHISIYYNDFIYDFHMKGIRKIKLKQLLKESDILIKLRYKNINKFSEDSLLKFIEDCNKCNYNYGFLYKNNTYCFDWIIKFLSTNDESLKENIKPTFLNSYYDAKSFLNNKLFDLKMIMINNEKIVYFN